VILRKTLEESMGIEWEKEGDIEWKLDESKGRLIVKEKGSLKE